LKIDKKKIATIVKNEDSENRIMRIDLEDEVLCVEYVSSWSDMKDLKGSVTKAAGMIIDHYRENKEEIGGLILHCMGENHTARITCLLSRDDVKRWIDYKFGIDELITRIQ
jgi:hypothetical protein